nr:hypothetical protein [Saprospiraceae bacterium]
MKSVLFFSFFIFLLSVTFTSCIKDDCTSMVEVTHAEPIIVTADEFRVDITSDADHPLEEAGKIYVYGNLLLINDLNKGIHVVDNTQPENPQFINFIGIRGNVDMAVRGNYLYADSYSDLLTIDVSDWMNPFLLHREEDVFRLHGWRDEGLVVGYTYETEYVEVDCNNQWRGGFLPFADQESASWDASGPSGFGNQNVQGQAGSMARFGIVSNHLYAIDDRSIHVFGLTNPGLPDNLNKVDVDWGGIETLFPYQQYLFIGGNTGMYIYDNSNPSAPVYLSQFSHANACDPVFASGNRAYVTLRNGNQCINAENQLDVLDISNISNPKLIKSYPMANPHGLSVIEANLFLCDGEAGLKIFDVTDDHQIDKNQLAHVKGGHTYDVIALGSDHIIVTGEKGIRQYDTSDKRAPRELSYLPIR